MLRAQLPTGGALLFLGALLAAQSPRLQPSQRPGLPPSSGTWQPHLIDGAMPAQAIFLRPGDLDGDGLQDLAAGAHWYESPGTAGGSWNRHPFGAPLNNISVLHDFDGDGDLDALGTHGVGSNANSDFAFAENDGAGNFSVHSQVASGSGDFLQGAVAGRLAGPTSPIQVALSWHAAGQGVQVLTVPSQPATQPWSFAHLSAESQDEDLSLGDIDGDGDDDLLLGTKWLENPSWQSHVLGDVSDLPGVGGTPRPDRNSLADVDGDGDLDAVLGLEHGTALVWFENPRPTGSASLPWSRHVFGDVDGQGFSLDVADFDGDGDPDVVVGEHRGTSRNRVLWFENDGQPTNWISHQIDDQPANVIDHHDGTQAVDVDGDGDLDVASIGWTHPKVWVFEHPGRGSTGVGTNYCLANVNDTGSAALLSGSGSASIGANDLQLRCGPIGTNRTGIFFFSDTPASQSDGTPFGEGRRCVVGSVARFLPPLHETGGFLNLAIDNTNLPGGVVIQPGETYFFQGWYRDTMDNNGDGVTSGFNLSDGLEIEFLP